MYLSDLGNKIKEEKEILLISQACATVISVVWSQVELPTLGRPNETDPLKTPSALIAASEAPREGRQEVMMLVSHQVSAIDRWKPQPTVITNHRSSGTLSSTWAIDLVTGSYLPPFGISWDELTLWWGQILFRSDRWRALSRWILNFDRSFPSSAL